MSQYKKILFFALLGLAFLLGFVLRPQLSANNASAATQALPEQRAVALAVEGQFVWLPNSFTYTVGEKIKLHLYNIDKLTPEGHGFAIPGLLNRPIFLAPGADQTIELSADKPGIYRYFCHIHGDIHIGGELNRLIGSWSEKDWAIK